jgi:quinol monooxygenase YgiN
MLEFVPKMEKKEEFITVVKNEILPILKKQTGFLEILPFFPETMTDKVLFFSLWTEKQYFERYRKDWFPKVEEIVRPYLTTPMTYKLYTLETKLCKHFEKAMAAQKTKSSCLCSFDTKNHWLFSGISGLSFLWRQCPLMPVFIVLNVREFIFSQH